MFVGNPRTFLHRTSVRCLVLSVVSYGVMKAIHAYLPYSVRIRQTYTMLFVEFALRFKTFSALVGS